MKFISLFLLALCSLAFAQDVPKDILDSMPAVSAWKPGANTTPLKNLEAYAFALSPKAAERAALETALCQAFDNANTREAKTFLGKMLRVVGTERAIPHAEKWLTDPDGTHGARLVLAALASPEASAAIHRALGKSDGVVRIGIINSLGDIAYAPALKDLIPLANDGEAGPAAIRAIGLIGGGDALTALSGIKPERAEAKRAHEHALLRACETANANQSRSVYQALFDGDDKRMKLAGLRGLVRTSPADAPALLTAAMQGDDPHISATAVAILSESGDEETTTRFAAMVKDLPPATQVPVLRALSERGDPAAADAVMERMKNGDETIRAAAVAAIASLGSGKHVPSLLDIATEGPGAREARSSLVSLSGDGVDAALAEAFKADNPERQVVAIRSAALRRADVTDDLIALLNRDLDDKIRKEAVNALSKTAKPSQAKAILQQAARPENALGAAGFETAIAALQKQSEDDKLDKLVLRGVKKAADNRERAVMVRFLDTIGSEDALALAKKHSASEDEALQDAAVRALIDWPTPAAAPALLDIAGSTENEIHKALALNSVVRLAEQADNAESLYAKAMDLAKTPAEQKNVLGGLASTSSLEALKLAASFIDHPEVKEEAALSAVSITERVANNDQPLARSVVAKIKANVDNKYIRDRAQNIVNELDKYDGYLLGGAWHVSPPYTLKEDSKAVWATSFAPDKGETLKWKPLTKGFTQTTCDLTATFGTKDNTAVYVRTAVWSDTDRDVRVELGSDDAFRFWANGEELLAWYGHRGTSPGSNKFKASLKKGWNPMLFKVVNHGGGWSFAFRLRNPDGSAPQGLRYDPTK